MDLISSEDPRDELRMLFATDVVAPPEENRLEGYEVLWLVEAVDDGAKGWP